jgi:hypothetical protein
MSENVKQEGEFKVKKKTGRPKKLVSDGDTVKVDLSKKQEETPQEEEVTKVVIKDEQPVEEVVEINMPEKEEEKAEEVQEEAPVLQEVAEEETPVTYEPEVEQPKINLPENIEKLVTFMNDTNGTIEDYVRLNADYSKADNDTLIREYYKHTKPHLEYDEVEFLLDDTFSYDEDMDDERTIKKKKLAYKEEVAKAKNFLETTKQKYYEEIKSRPGINADGQKAIDFFNRYNEEQKVVQSQHQRFQNNTKKFFTDNFKGFDIKVGEKKFRYGVKNTDNVAKAQSDLTNFIGKFLDEKGEVQDYAGYHKAIFAAENVDTIAQHFYEQGKADAVKDVMAKSKNITTDKPRTSPGEVFTNGIRVRAISGADSSKLKINTTYKSKT